VGRKNKRRTGTRRRLKEAAKNTDQTTRGSGKKKGQKTKVGDVYSAKIGRGGGNKG